MLVLKIPKTSIIVLITIALFASVAPAAAAQEAGATEASAVGLSEQTGLALTHANAANQASTLADLKHHAEHVVNIIEGSGGSNFGDLDGDGTTENPGDGQGVLSYAAAVVAHAQDLADALPDDTDVQSEAANVIAAVGNANNLAVLARNQALQGIAATDLVVARFSASNAVDRLTDALNGSDEDGDGVVEPIEGEAGAVTVYLHSQNLGAFVAAAGGAGS
jgi:hypothetical protein